jgi:TPR repeat protein
MYALGMLYENDSNGVKDKDKSEFWYAKVNTLN